MKVALCVLVCFAVVGILDAAFMPGGYHDRNVDDAEVIEAANFAAGEMGHELVEILEAQSQVVAGMNFKLKLSLRKGNKTKTCNVEVFRGLGDAGHQLTSRRCLRL